MHHFFGKYYIKLRFSEKATKFEKNLLLLVLILTRYYQNKWEIYFHSFLSYWDSQTEGSSKQWLIKSQTLGTGSQDLYFLNHFTCTWYYTWELSELLSHETEYVKLQIIKWFETSTSFFLSEFLYRLVLF